MINEQKELGRGKNAVLSYLEQKLYVPKIFLDTEWDGCHVDLLAIDRDGSGDVIAVLLFARRYREDGRVDTGAQQTSMEALIKQFEQIPVNYKYIAAVETMRMPDWRAVFRLPDGVADSLFSPDFVGRIGVLHIDAPEDAEARIELIVRPERFRARVAKLADEYLQQHLADWEIRA
jgi:hypothetical protein